MIKQLYASSLTSSRNWKTIAPDSLINGLLAVNFIISSTATNKSDILVLLYFFNGLVETHYFPE